MTLWIASIAHDLMWKQEPWEQVKFIGNTSADENNPALFWDKKRLVEFTVSYLLIMSVKNSTFI